MAASEATKCELDRVVVVLMLLRSDCESLLEFDRVDEELAEAVALVMAEERMLLVDGVEAALGGAKCAKLEELEEVDATPKLVGE